MNQSATVAVHNSMRCDHVGETHLANATRCTSNDCSGQLADVLRLIEQLCANELTSLHCWVI